MRQGMHFAQRKNQKKKKKVAMHNELKDIHRLQGTVGLHNATHLHYKQFMSLSTGFSLY